MEVRTKEFKFDWKLWTKVSTMRAYQRLWWLVAVGVAIVVLAFLMPDRSLLVPFLVVGAFYVIWPWLGSVIAMAKAAKQPLYRKTITFLFLDDELQQWLDGEMRVRLRYDECMKVIVLPEGLAIHVGSKAQFIFTPATAFDTPQNLSKVANRLRAVGLLK